MNSEDTTILTIDDEEAIRDSIASYLEYSDYRVLQAENGSVGLEVFRGEKPDLVLVDLRMPGINGMEVLSAIKEEAPEIPVIVISGTGIMGDVIRALRLGAADYITKPIEDMGFVEHAIDRALERARLIRENRVYKENLEKMVLKRTEQLEKANAQLIKEMADRIKAEEEIRKLNEDLEKRVKVRTLELQITNESLIESLETLKKTKDQLVQSEKMASLGSLVTGVAHEINTPLGVGITAASFLEDTVNQFSAEHASLTEEVPGFDKLANKIVTASSTILKNLERAATLVGNFKLVAVDQTSDEKRLFRVKDYINNVLLTLYPRLKEGGHSIRVNCPDNLEILSYPGAFSRILNNLIMNSLIHGFDGQEKGEVLVDISLEEDELCFQYHDDGIGMDEYQVKRIFDPFYTTKRGSGGTGLGMYIVYNLVIQTLRGEIFCTSRLSKETAFKIVIPIESE
ncbi:MAG: response regulator [bacterium]|nr:response regulator [bacterium]